MRGFIKGACLFVAVSLIAASCVTTQSYDEIVGKGRVDLSAKTWAHFKKYQDRFNSGAFAYNPRTNYAYYNYCADVQCAAGNRAREAVAGCTERSGPGCKLFAQNGEILWRGPVFVEGHQVSSNSSGSASASTAKAPGLSLPAKFRLVTPAGAGEWQAGKLNVADDGRSNVFDAEFMGGARCSGQILGAIQFSTSDKYFTSLKGQCRMGSSGAQPIGFSGFINMVARHTGHITGDSGPRRKVEIVFQPGR